MKRFAMIGRLVAIFFACLALSAHAENSSAAEENALLWSISKSGKVVGYLLGTMHSEDERVLALSKQIEPKIKELQCVALELELSDENSMKAMQTMFFNDGKKLKDVVTPVTYKRTIELLNSDHGLPEQQAQYMKPWAAMMILSVPKPVTGMFLDKSLYTYALNAKYKVVGLESAEEQISVMDDMKISEQVALLESTLAEYEHMPEMLEKLLTAYLHQDLGVMQEMYREFTKDTDQHTFEVLTERLINVRNELMVNRMKALYSESRCVTAVGALHLPGEQGLINKLRKHGFVLNPMNLKL